MNLPAHGHDPVLLNEVLDALQPRSGSTIVDCTVGRGGHAEAIAQLLGRDGTLIVLDADPANLEYTRHRLVNSAPAKRFFHANFADLNTVLNECAITHVDGILSDLGLSTTQFLNPDYGISFGEDGPLDMRLDRRSPLTAEQVVNRTPERELADLIYQLSDERFSRRIARKIVEARKLSPIKSTRELAELVRSAVPRRGAGSANDRIDPATRTFMAIRMKVNGEMENLARLLEVAPQRLKKGGRMAVISFHSLEDRAVKQAFRSAEQTGLLRVVTKKPLCPSDTEITANPRARSAKLRVAEKT
jgi:16S rRNA (cytosine1402-N4)-methyltransferase